MQGGSQHGILKNSGSRDGEASKRVSVQFRENNGVRAHPAQQRMRQRSDTNSMLRNQKVGHVPSPVHRKVKKGSRSSNNSKKKIAARERMVMQGEMDLASSPRAIGGAGRENASGPRRPPQRKSPGKAVRFSKEENNAESFNGRNGPSPRKKNVVFDTESISSGKSATSVRCPLGS